MFTCLFRMFTQHLVAPCIAAVSEFVHSSVTDPWGLHLVQNYSLWARLIMCR